MVAIHFAYHIGGSTRKHIIKELDLVLPATMGSMLFIWKQEVLPTVEHSPWCSRSCNLVDRVRIMVWESSIRCSNSQHAAKSQQKCCGAASLQNKLVWKDEHARLRKEIGIDVIGLHDREDLAIDQIQHILPCLCGHCLQAILLYSRRKGVLVWGKPDFKQFLGA